MKLIALVGLVVLTSCTEPRTTALSAHEATATLGTQSVETGQVKWLRNLDEAKQLAAKVEKPILILFQEIPG